MDNWKNILDEDILKTNINFVAVFVMNYECLKEFVIEQIRDFYSEHFYMDGDRIVCEESSTYKEKVRALDKNLENASLKWFIDDNMSPTMSVAETMNLKLGGNTMALSRFEQAKIMILGGAYNRETLERQLKRYYEKGDLTKDEYETLIALMDAKELVTEN